MSGQLAAFRAEGPNTAKQTYKNNPTLAAIFDAYLAEKRSPLAYKKCKHPETLRVNLIQPRALWGAMAIEDFRAGSKARVKAVVQGWLSADPPLALATCRKRVTIMRAAFRFAVSEEIIERGQEPVFELPPSGPARERHVDPEDELPTLLKTADAVRTPYHIRLALLLLLITGQRVGALLALRWHHVDFENRVIRFRETEAAHERGKKRRVDQPLDDELFDILTAAKERALSDAVIEWNERPVKTIFPAMKRLFARAGMPDLRVHDLRRTSATLVYHALGGDLSGAAKHIGDTEKMAESTYIQKRADVNLPGIRAVSKVIALARKSAA